MTKASAEDFIELFQAHGATETAKILDMSERNVYARRARLANRRGRPIYAPGDKRDKADHPARVAYTIDNGTIIVGSDCHYWPHYISTAHRAFVHLCDKMKPECVILNGDVLDGASISRFPSIGWESKPTLVEEMETVDARLGEIQAAAKNAKLIWTLGNHDSRFETKIANMAPEFKGVFGVHLKDHFPHWHPTWSVWVNDDLVIKHRWKGGIHATRNNTLNSGKSMLTGHLHSLKVTPLSDYNGVRWGIDSGTMADPYGPQFTDYTEDAPVDWRSGLIVLTYRAGRLMWPEIVHVLDEESVEFRGEIIKV